MRSFLVLTKKTSLRVIVFIYGDKWLSFKSLSVRRPSLVKSYELKSAWFLPAALFLLRAVLFKFNFNILLMIPRR